MPDPLEFDLAQVMAIMTAPEAGTVKGLVVSIAES